MKKLIKFPNGLTLLYCQMPEVRSVSVGVFVKVGSLFENNSNNGISHFIEHTMFKGTARRTAFDIVAETDAIGANINAFTSKTTTCYYVQSLDSDVEKSFDILSDIYFNSVFPQNEIEKEKGVVLEEIAMCNDTPDDLSYELASSAFYKGSPFSRPILGSKNNVSSFTREDIFDYISTHYTADNTYISVAGNISLEKTTDLINKYFIASFSGVKCKKRKISVPNTNSVYVKKFKKIEQGNLNIVFPSVAYAAPTANAVRILNMAFGFGMSSRLYQQIREKLGLAYSVYSYLSFYENCGHSMIYLGTNVSNIEKAVDAVSGEIKKLKEGGISEEEFSRGKAQFKSGFVFNGESSNSFMNLLGRYALITGKLLDIDEVINAIDNVTLDDVNDVIKTSFDTSLATLAYVGPKTDKNLLEILKN